MDRLDLHCYVVGVRLGQAIQVVCYRDLRCVLSWDTFQMIRREFEGEVNRRDQYTGLASVGSGSSIFRGALQGFLGAEEEGVESAANGFKHCYILHLESYYSLDRETVDRLRHWLDLGFVVGKTRFDEGCDEFEWDSETLDPLLAATETSRDALTPTLEGSCSLEPNPGGRSALRLPYTEDDWPRVEAGILQLERGIASDPLRWDPSSLTLWIGQCPLLTLAEQAHILIRILNMFQQGGWVPEAALPNPLAGQGCAPTRSQITSLQKGVSNLNREIIQAANRSAPRPSRYCHFVTRDNGSQVSFRMMPTEGSSEANRTR